ncbi:CMP-N-acetylneuraminate-poly-alpha-2,8-sialyltransferase-like [Strongylocentrotus purpuratus]|uniref:ST8 alpha-N-acetyl-neuraminide alpha-2,8-sialyltransferase 6 n=1 Tax=Strongylocentrotus purpuratus TaxID=7668 RepID=A0A7M7PRB7_STRPU|nr:CMP-N-acetylneuraminate-poly-alpha-2,8-sialyltransferase-like [Strongylocentrotus purpuratus]
MKNNSMLSKIWNFRDIGDQLLYVYEKLVKKDWTANQTNAHSLRQELARYRPELNDSTTIILHQKNVKINDSIKKVYSKEPIKITPEIFHRLSKSDPIGLPKGKRYHSCALVGNSGSILHSGCGERIDKHDYVIRCNLAPLAPFKVDAGLKSDYITMNPSIIRTRYRRFRTRKAIKKFNVDVSKYSGILSIPCFGIRLPEVMKAFKLFKGKKPKMACMNTKHFQSVIDFWGSTGAIDKGLSTGFYMVSMAIQLCDEIDLYGFWPFSSRFESNKTDVAYHYFDNIRPDTAEKHHAMDQEFSIIVQLHNLGIVNLNIGSC